ncbi:hypothetical protein QVD17_06946 [Tagetes erecta]|uniref:Uncharacterized protein n=1 Tax=Tagetes erecta TaxID=13708 RepID=A0AAD8PBQ2_TARER|nr:hypothetical protein QVD17_06946 [Tagetes erecta]
MKGAALADRDEIGEVEIGVETGIVGNVKVEVPGRRLGGVVTVGKGLSMIGGVSPRSEGITGMVIGGMTSGLGVFLRPAWMNSALRQRQESKQGWPFGVDPPT